MIIAMIRKHPNLLWPALSVSLVAMLLGIALLIAG